MNRSRAFVLAATTSLLAVPAATAGAVAAIAAPAGVATATAGASAACADSWRNPAGGAWSSGADWSTGQPPTAHEAACITLPLRAAVVLSGAGDAASLLLGGGEQLVLQGAQLTLNGGSSINAGAMFGGGSVALEPGAVLSNTGAIVAAPGESLTLAGDVDNRPAGTIVAAGDSPYGASLVLEQGSLRNAGAVEVGALNSSLTAESGSTIANDTGTITNAGMLTVGTGASFVQGAGTTTGNPIVVEGGSLELQGSGASEFVTAANLSHPTTLSGNVAPAQTIHVEGSSLSPTTATASFTNHGTIVGDGYLALPPGGTLTNDGAIEDGHGSLGSGGLALEGNLTNTAAGTMGEENGGFEMARAGTRLVNAGRLYMLFSNTLDLTATESVSHKDITFDNDGTIYAGVGGDAAWGGLADASNIEAYLGDDVHLGGTIVPVPNVEPQPSAHPGGEITYGITDGHLIANVSEWTLSCGARVTEGWSLQCGDTATLVETRSTTLEPTEVSVVGSGSPAGSDGGWQTADGHAVTISATVSAGNESLPTGTVTFFAAQQDTAGTAALRPDLLGTAALVTGGKGEATATLTTTALVPGRYLLLAIYGGDRTHLAASTQYGQPSPSNEPHTFGNEVVTPQPTALLLSASRLAAPASTPVTLIATLRRGAPGSGVPSGLVVFEDNGTPIGVARLKLAGGSPTARLTTALPAGASSLTASYSGDYDFAGAGSAPLAVKIGT